MTLTGAVKMINSHTLRLWRLPGFLIQTAQYLTSNETSTALRPFYFSVHPDLFGRYPEQRAVNESSLKHLNEYLHKLQQRSTARPVTLHFYVRQINSDSANEPVTNKAVHGNGETIHVIQPQVAPKRVNIQLASPSIYSTIRHILQTCDLPLTYVNTLKPASTASPNVFARKIKWDPSFYAYYNLKTPEAHTMEARQPVLLHDWLVKNVEVAQTKQASLEPIRQEVVRLRAQVCEETGLRDIVWDSAWSQTQYRAALRGLGRLCRQHSNIDLKDRCITFSDVTGVCCHGNIILKVNDIAESWLHNLRTAPRHQHLVNKLSTLELYLSTLLNNLPIIRRQKRPPLAEIYFRQLRRITSALRDHLEEDNKALQADLSQCQAVIECMTGPLLVAPSGEFHLSSTCPAFLIFDFLNKKAATAKEQLLLHESTHCLKMSLVEDCSDLLGLSSLEYAENLSPENVITCLKHLLQDGNSLPVSLEDCRLKITSFYSIMSDGVICVPWNYRMPHYNGR